ncbi:MAG: pyrroline-5-carboxylate reductase [Clostridiales bacterium]|nr:pyrroline-5-carboxylate reductase [Clostridiales bacterium]
MFENQKIIFLGDGNMAGAMIRGIVEKKIMRPEQVMVLGLAGSQKVEELVGQYGVKAAGKEDIAEADLVFLAFKPQDLAAAMADYQPFLREGQTILSILAGISCQTIESYANGAAVVRFMPNLALCVGLSATAFCLGQAAGQAQADIAQALFAPLGVVVQVNEEQMSGVTAVSGSGPAYFYALTEAMAAAAVRDGMEAESAERLAVQTLIGAAKLIADAGVGPEVMRQRITSKGGTTAAALAAMEQAGFYETVEKGYLACRDRSDELGGVKKKS